MEAPNDVETQKISIICPICNAEKEIKIPQSIMKKNGQLTTISVEKSLICEHHFQVFIDKNFKIRGYQKVDFELKGKTKPNEKSEKSINRENLFFKNLYKDGNYLSYEAKEPIDWNYLLDDTEKIMENGKPNFQSISKNMRANQNDKEKWLKHPDQNKSEKQSLFQDAAAYYQERRNKIKNQRISNKSRNKVSGGTDYIQNRTLHPIERLSNEVEKIYQKERFETNQILENSPNAVTHSNKKGKLEKFYEEFKDLFHLDPYKFKHFIKFQKRKRERREIENSLILEQY